MDADSGAVLRATGDGDLELARQVGEFGMVGRPLPEDLGIKARIDDLFRGGACKMIGRDVTYAIAAGLDGVQVGLGKHGEDVRRVL